MNPSRLLISLFLLALFVTPAVGEADFAWERQGKRARLEILASDNGERDVDQRVMIALPPAGDWSVAELRIDGLAVSSKSHVALSEPFIYRRVRSGQLLFLPPAKDWLGATIEIEFEGSYPAKTAVPSDPLLEGIHLNSEDIRLRANAQTERSGRAGDELFDGSGKWIRINITESGVYRLSYNKLWQAGVDPATDTSTFRLFGTGGASQPFRIGMPGGSWERGWEFSEIPLQVIGGDSFGSDTKLLAYLPGLDGWSSESEPGADWESYRRNYYAPWATYYLTWDGDPGARITDLVATPSGGDPIVDSVPARIHRERNYEYSNRYLHEDGWAWHYFFSSTSPETWFDRFPLISPDAGSPFRLRVGYDAPRSGSDFPAGPHQLRAYLRNESVPSSPDAAHLLFEESFSIASGTSQAILEGSRLLPAEMEDAETGRFSLELPKEGPPLSMVKDFGYLLWYEVYYETHTRTRNSAPLELHVPADQARAEIPISGWSAEPEIWDVTDPLAPLRLTGGEYNAGTMTVSLATPARRHLRCFDTTASAGMKIPDRVQAANPKLLRNDDGMPHMIIVYYDAFGNQARRLAEWRSAHFPGGITGEIETVAIGDIYANFSSGMQDPAALRNFIKYRYETLGSRLSYVLLLGDADSDYRNFLSRETVGDGSNCLVPAVSDRFRAELAPNGTTTDHYTTDDYAACMDIEDDDFRRSVPDVAMGRLPAASGAAATQMVDMVIDYDSKSAPGLWKNRITIAADDNALKCDWENHGDRIPHTGQAEILVHSAFPTDLDLKKIYLCNYDCDFGGFKPTAQRDLFEQLEAGTLIFNYIGHGGNDVLADEQLLLTSRLFSLRNDDRRFMFVSASCNVGEHDDPSNVSMSETMIGMEDGGAIATMASSALSQAFFNNILNKNFLVGLFPDLSLHESQAIGLALLQSKVRTQLVDMSGNVGAQNERYSILGDPSLRLSCPELSVEFDAAGSDTLRIGETVSLSGRITRGGIFAPDFNGEILLSVWASADTTGCDWGDDNHWDFNLPGPEIFRGSIAVADGRFTTPSFFVPGLPETYLGGYGRVRAFAIGREEAVGNMDRLQVETGILPADDTPPQVQLSLAGGATTAAPGMELSVHAESESGINLIGTHPRNSTFIEFVEAGLIENLTERFEYETGSASVGAARSLLPDGLPDGINTIVASVADNLGNVSRDTLRVEMFEEGRADLRGVQPFPNPFDGRVAITFEVTQAATVDCVVYTLSGRRVRSLHLDCPAAGRYAFDWDGRDGAGDEVANGTYLYRMVAIYDGNESRRREESGAIVRMRD